MKTIWEKLKSDENTQRTALIVLINVIFVSVFCFLNFNTGIFADDYGYHFCFSLEDKITDVRVGSLGQLFKSQYAHYFLMNGRAVAHTLLQFSLMFGKPFFNILNTCFYFALANGMYLLAKKPGSKRSPVLMTLAYLLPWLLYPKYAEIFLLACVSAGYHWMMVLVLYFLIPFKYLFWNRDLFENHNIPGTVLMFIFGIAAGWASENGSAAMLFLLGCFGLYMLISKKKIPIWCYSGFIGGVIGFLMMVRAPGYQVRMESFDSKINWLARVRDLIFAHTMRYSTLLFIISFVTLLILLTNSKFRKYAFFGSIAAMLLHFIIPLKSYKGGVLFDSVILFVSSALIIYLLCLEKRITTRRVAAFMLFITAITANTAMIATPLFQIRSEFPFFIFLCVSAIAIIEKFLEVTAQYKNVNKSLAVVLIAVSIFTLTETAIAAPANYKYFTDREKNIEISKQNGVFDIKFEEIPASEDPHLLTWTIWSDDPEYWINKSICNYYGIDSVVHH